MALVQKIRCRVKEIINHGDHVYSVDLKPERVVPKFRPGQFLHLALDDYDPSGFWPESRVFSIASSPAERDRLFISYSVKGRFTARMENELSIGKSVWVKLPYGNFVVNGASDVVLIAGGTGITPFISFLNNLMPDFPHQICLVYGARRRKLLIYLDQIYKIQNEIPQLKVYTFVEDLSENLKGDSNIYYFPEILGIISLDFLWDEIRIPKETTYYLSGPPGMLKNLSAQLMQRGIQRENICIDSWD